IEPPEVHDQCDEDSADEDNGGLVDNLTGQQLRAPAESVLISGERIGGDNELEEKKEKSAHREDTRQTRFKIYQDKIPNTHVNYETKYGKPVLQMTDFPQELKALPFDLYFDNLFTGILVLSHLKELEYGGTGTIRQNRIPKDCPMQNLETLKKTKWRT
ncbi:hypothetical protein ANN_01465, partial [Periplaneta americana]